MDLINCFFFLKITCMATFGSLDFVLPARSIVIYKHGQTGSSAAS